MNMKDGLHLQLAYLIIHSQLFIAAITRCSANFGAAADS